MSYDFFTTKFDPKKIKAYRKRQEMIAKSKVDISEMLMVNTHKTKVSKEPLEQPAVVRQTQVPSTNRFIKLSNKVRHKTEVSLAVLPTEINESESNLFALSQIQQPKQKDTREFYEKRLQTKLRQMKDRYRTNLARMQFRPKYTNYLLMQIEEIINLNKLLRQLQSI